MTPSFLVQKHVVSTSLNAFEVSSTSGQFSRKLATQDSVSEKACRLRSPVRPREFMMDITIDAGFITELRRLLMSTCGDVIAFIRIQPIRHATQARIWLGMTSPAIDRIMDVVMKHLPGAEFGHLSRV